MNLHLSEQIARQHAQDLLRESERVRIVEAAEAGRPRSGIHCQALAWLGSQLIAWGWRLRARYGAVEHEPAV